jgi:hypothetical protein
MTRPPVTLADQGVFIEPDDADDLVDLLLEAAGVLHRLACVPEAEAAAARAGAVRGSACAGLACDLQLAAAGLDEAATAGQENTYMPASEWKGRGPRETPATRPGKTTLRRG